LVTSRSVLSLSSPNDFQDSVQRTSLVDEPDSRTPTD
jgi:hypothetical protein